MAFAFMLGFLPCDGLQCFYNLIECRSGLGGLAPGLAQQFIRAAAFAFPGPVMRELGDKGPEALTAVNDSLPFEFLVGPLHRYDTDEQIFRKRPEGGQSRPRTEPALTDLAPDAVDDLLIERARNRRRNRREQKLLILSRVGHEWLLCICYIHTRQWNFGLYGVAVNTWRIAATKARRKSRFTRGQLFISFRKTILSMRTSISLLALVVAGTLFSTGCAGPERKLGRGMNNATEVIRLGELRRSMEQTALWDDTDSAYTTGMLRGLNRTLARTAVGLYEVVTFPIPSYDPVFLPENPVYPESYRPHLLADPTFGPDAALGFSGGDIAPFIPGSRFRIFDY